MAVISWRKKKCNIISKIQFSADNPLVKILTKSLPLFWIEFDWRCTLFYFKLCKKIDFSSTWWLFNQWWQQQRLVIPSIKNFWSVFNRVLTSNEPLQQWSTCRIEKRMVTVSSTADHHRTLEFFVVVSLRISTGFVRFGCQIGKILIVNKRLCLIVKCRILGWRLNQFFLTFTINQNFSLLANWKWKWEKKFVKIKNFICLAKNFCRLFTCDSTAPGHIRPIFPPSIPINFLSEIRWVGLIFPRVLSLSSFMGY